MRPRVVLVAHRSAMVAEGLAAGLRRFPGIIPVGVATTAAEAVAKASRTDAVAVDQYMPGAERVARSLRRGGVRVVMIGEEGDDGGDEGVRISTRAPLSALAAALAPESVAISSTPRGTTLTPREREIVDLVVHGLAGKQIARHLGISPKTVERHKTRIFAKLGVSNQTAAVRAVLDGAAERDGNTTIDVREFPPYRVTAAAGNF